MASGGSGLLPQACARCWRRKQVCDKRRPRCQRCVKANAECVGRHHGQTLSPQRQHGESYIESLQLRVRQLEQESDRNNVQEHDPAEREMQLLGEAGNPRMLADLHYLPLSAMAGLSKQRTQSSEADLSLGTLLQAVLYDRDGRSRAEEDSGMAMLSALFPVAFTLGLKPIYLQALKAFTDYCEHIYSAFDHGMLQAEIDAAVSSEGYATDKPEMAMLLQLIIATGLHIAPALRDWSSLAKILKEDAYRKLSDLVKSSSKDAVLECLTVMTVLTSVTGSASAWNMLSLAVTRCLSLGFHTSEVSDMGSDSFTKRQKGRLFWALHNIDTTISVAFRRPFCLNDHDITTQLPPSVEDDDSPRLICIRHAQLIRGMAKSADVDMIFHVANYAYWKDNAVGYLHRVAGRNTNSLEHHVERMLAQLIIEMVIRAVRYQRELDISARSRLLSDLVQYIAALQRRVQDRTSVVTGLDALVAFATAPCLALLNEHSSDSSASMCICQELIAVAVDRIETPRQMQATLKRFIGAMQQRDIATFERSVMDIHTSANNASRSHKSLIFAAIDKRRRILTPELTDG